MKLKERVAARIKAIRHQRGMSQELLAERIDRTTDAVSNLERGKSLPSFGTLERLSAALDVPVKDFFDDEPGKRGSAKRAALVAVLVDTARSLSDHDLDVAVQQVRALAKRGPTEPRKSSKRP